MHYLLILAADALLAANFTTQKKYQSLAGTGVGASLMFNAFVGLSTLIIFLLLGLFGAFSIQFSPYSLLMASIMTILCLSYTVLGFKLLRAGNMPLYTMFLMTGGMLLPYLFGLAFLDETFSWLRLIGIILIVAAVVISNTGATKPTKGQLIMCCAVFILNGFVSIASKVHQADISAHLNPVNTESYVILMAAVKILLCFPIVYFVLKKEKSDSQTPFLSLVPLFVLSAVFDGVSCYFQLIGAVDIPAGVLYPLVTAGSIILSAIAGMIVFRERPSKNQWLAMAVCLAGTCMFI